MRLTEQLVHALSSEVRRSPLSPDALACAVGRLLPVDAAGITTMVDGLRLPLGATSAAARVAEELQTTLGDGPCLASARTGGAVVFRFHEIRQRWPLYADELQTLTPYRSVAAIPLCGQGPVVGALELYAVDDELGERIDVSRVAREIGEPLAALLRLCLGEVSPYDAVDGLGAPPWYARNTARRHRVWIAVGMLFADSAVPITSSSDAVDLLRGYAYAHELSLDDVAAALVEGRATVGEVLDVPPDSPEESTPDV